MFWLKSVRLGILGMLTLLTTSVTVYGSMYLLDIELNIGTTLVTFLVVGVVDYAVHLLSRIKMLVQKGIEIDEAILAAMQGACVLKTARGAMAVQGRRSGFSGLFPGVRTGIASEHL